MKKIRLAIFYLLLGLLFTFPLGVIFRFQPLPFVGFYPQDFFVAGLFLCILILGIKNKRIFSSQIGWSLGLFTSVGVVSLLINASWLTPSQIGVSLLYSLRFLTYASLLFIAAAQFTSWQKVFIRKALLISSGCVVVFGFIQYVFYDNLRNLYYLGWDEHLFRMFSTFLDPNFAGAFFALFSLLLLRNVFSFQGRSVYLNSILFMVTCVALLLTHSRTAFLMLVIGVVIFLISLKRYRLLFGIVVMLAVGLIIFSNTQVEGLNPFRFASVEARITSMKEAWYVFGHHPFLGVGFNAYRYALMSLGLRPENTIIYSNADAGTDNSLLFVLATSGIVGLVAYLNIWRSIIYKVSNVRYGIQKVTLYSIIAALFVGSFYINLLFYAQVMVWVFLYIGLSIKGEDVIQHDT